MVDAGAGAGPGVVWEPIPSVVGTGSGLGLESGPTRGVWRERDVGRFRFSSGQWSGGLEPTSEFGQLILHMAGGYGGAHHLGPAKILLGKELKLATGFQATKHDKAGGA